MTVCWNCLFQSINNKEKLLMFMKYSYNSNTLHLPVTRVDWKQTFDVYLECPENYAWWLQLIVCCPCEVPFYPHLSRLSHWRPIMNMINYIFPCLWNIHYEFRLINPPGMIISPAPIEAQQSSVHMLWNTLQYIKNKIQSSVVTILSNITWYCTQYNSDRSRMNMRVFIHKTPLSRPHGWAMGCLLWRFGRKLSTL